MLRHALLAFMILVVVSAPPAHAAMVRKASPHSVTVTAERLEAAAAAKGMTVFGRIDHAAGATKAGLDLKPTVLVMFGNPKGGTPLMQAEPTMGLSLPLKVLVWEDADGKVHVGYDPFADLAALRGLDPDHPALGKAEAALDAITSEAVAP
jgi:uncharacterized protein (DUF302 family)